MATIGRHAAVAKLPGGRSSRARSGWLAWLGLHLLYLVGFRNRLRVMINWTWRYFDWPSGPRLIVADAETAEIVQPRRSSRSLDLLAKLGGQMVAELGEVLADQGHLGAPFVGVHGEQFLHVTGRHVEPARTSIDVGVGHVADGCGDGLAAPGAALEDPLEHPAVLAVAGPEPLAVGALAEPVDVEDLGQAFSSKRSEKVSQCSSSRPCCSRRRAASRRGRGEGGPPGPAAAAVVSEDTIEARNTPWSQSRDLEDQRRPARTAPAEEDRVDRHARGVLPLGRDRRVLMGGGGEARVRVRGGRAHSLLQVLPRQSVRPSGGSPMPSHQTSPSAVSAVLVKMVFASIESMALGLVVMLVPGATPKNPASGLIA